MKLLPTVLCLLAAAATPGLVQADRNLLSVVETVDINAAPAAVWSQISDFNGMAAWHPAIADSQLVSGKNNEAGAARELQIKDGPSLTDELVSIDDTQRVFIYRLVDSPLPLTDYLSSVTVKSRGEGSEVIWTATFRRKNVSASTPKEENDQAAIALLSGVYRAGLDNLKKMLDN